MPVSTDDYVAVADHIARYCWKVDGGDADGWAALWTEDGVFTGITPEPLVGRAVLRNVPLGVKADVGDTMAHKAVNIFCDYGENTDTIHAHLYNYVTTWMPGAPGKPNVMARCVMTLVRSGSGWLIQRNEANLLRGV
jgi:hypothetical protein